MGEGNPLESSPDEVLVRGLQSGDALERFERMTALPMLVLALAIIPLLVVPLTVDLSPVQAEMFLVIDWMIWAAFAAEYGIRLYLSPDRKYFVRHNLLDLAFVLLPFLRPLRIARSARAFRLLRAARAVVIFGRAAKAARNVFTRHKLHYALLVALFAIVGGGILVSDLEKGAAESNIKTAADGIWWAVTTVSTVGYGDHFRVTPEAKGIAVLLMIVGIGLFGLLAASLASYFVEQGREPLSAKVDELQDQLNRMEAMLSRAVAAGDDELGFGMKPISVPENGDGIAGHTKPDR
jgi:voltage-gated potassium channel